MKIKSLFLTVSLTVAFYSTALAESAKDLYEQAAKFDEQGNYSQAVKLYEQACDGGYAFACHNLGVSYETGEGVQLDFARAAQLYEKACNGGDFNACTNLGSLYGRGHGVEQNFPKAVQLWKKSCNQDDKTACFNLGISYKAGESIISKAFWVAQLARPSPLARPTPTPAYPLALKT